MWLFYLLGWCYSIKRNQIPLLSHLVGYHPKWKGPSPTIWEAWIAISIVDLVPRVGSNHPTRGSIACREKHNGLRWRWGAASLQNEKVQSSQTEEHGRQKVSGSAFGTCTIIFWVVVWLAIVAGPSFPSCRTATERHLPWALPRVAAFQHLCRDGQFIKPVTPKTFSVVWFQMDLNNPH